MYSSTAGSQVNIFNLNSLFEHFSLGNIGFNEEICQISNLEMGEAFNLYPDLTPIETNAGKTPINKPIAMQFQCNNEKDYIVGLADWGFLFKIDLKLETFSDASTKCSTINLSGEHV